MPGGINRHADNANTHAAPWSDPGEEQVATAGAAGAELPRARSAAQGGGAIDRKNGGDCSCATSAVQGLLARGARDLFVRSRAIKDPLQAI